jgi:hypothetical protein
MEKYTLRAIKLDVDFRSSEISNYDFLVKKKHFPGPPAKRDVYLMVSKSGNQLIWVLNVGSVGKNGDQRDIVDTRRWRLRRGSWNPHLLENYANAVGLSLVGFKRFEEIYAESRAN